MRSKDPIKESMSRVFSVITSLTLRGYEVERVREIDGVNRPTIVVRFNGRCEQAQREGKAMCYMSGCHPQGHYRKWQMRMNDCRVLWRER